MKDCRTIFLKGIGIVLLVKKFLKEFKDLLTFTYILERIGFKERSSEKGTPR